ncbi:hypothetical protein HMPREF0290_0541 [Corynebacterium efficiens YS-314]|nr:hypothetical protein HMPREF0290_0541 [Corynebacterium efficiens YS-314]
MGFVAVSMLIAWGLGIRRKSWSRPNLSSTSGWTKALREQLPEGSIPEVTIGTHSGGLWKGRVVHYTADLELENREIVLRPPFEIQLGTEVKHPNPGWSSIVIPAKEISWMAVSYRRIETNTISPAVEPTANLTKD